MEKEVKEQSYKEEYASHSSQTSYVNSFSNSLNNINNIKNRIDNSKNKNLKQNLESSLPNTDIPSLDKPKLEDSKNKKGLLNKDKNKNKNKPILNNPTNKNKGINSNAKKIDLTKKIGKKLLESIKMLMLVFTTPVGWAILAILGIIALIFLLVIILALIVNSLGMKFGLSGNETLEAFNQICPEGYTETECQEKIKEYQWTEGMTKEEIEELMSEADEFMCKQGFLDNLRHLFGMWNLESGDTCEVAHYIKHLLEEKEKETGINPISPGYLLTTFYYAFSTQNRDENGDLFINPTDYIENDKSTEEAKEVNDLDAITTILAAKVYNRKDVEDLLDKYIINNKYKYYIWTEVIIEDDNGNERIEEKCFEVKRNDYSMSPTKFQLYLRYGDHVMNQYVAKRNMFLAYEYTDAKCKNNLKFPEPSLEELQEFNLKADPDTITDDNAKIKVEIIQGEEGFKYKDFGAEDVISGTYGYDSGFIFKTFPKYDEKYSIDNKVDYDYKVDKDIEFIIENIDSKQDYSNYILGYDSVVEEELEGSNSGSIGGSTGGSIGGSSSVCNYNFEGTDISNIKVRLLHGKSPNGIVNSFDVIEGEELVDFEKYVLGVVNGEIGTKGYDAETIKAQAIAARSYALARVKGIKNVTLKEENGQWILSIRSSNEDQVYCDPDKGCYKCSGYNSYFTAGNTPAGASCKLWAPPLKSDSYIRSAAKEVVGMLLLDSGGNPLHASYNSTIQAKWESLAKSGDDYTEILRKHYGNEYTIESGKCSISSGGEYVWPTDPGWKIVSPFGPRKAPKPGASTFHQGIDISGLPKDSPIYAIQDGIVSDVGRNSSMGNYIKVDHGNGYESVYMHMNKHMSGLSKGDSVKAGQQIGYMGTTGISTGVHLHLGIKYNGKYVDPAKVMGIKDTKG